MAYGSVIEGRLDKGRGPVATLLIQNGTLRSGNPIVVGATYGRVRRLVDNRGREIKSAGPATPVEITGLNNVLKQVISSWYLKLKKSATCW